MAYGLLTPREPVNEKLGWLDNPKNIGLLSAALGILANNRGNYGAFGPAVGQGGLLGLQAAMQTQQTNALNRRENRREARGDYFNRERLGLLKRELGLKEEEIGAENRAGGLVGGVLGGYSGESPPVTQGVPNFTQPQAIKLPYSEANLAQMQQPAVVEAQANVVEGDAPWKAVDAQILQLDDLVKQDPAIARTKVYKDTYERLHKTREFLSKRGEVRQIGESGLFYQEGMGKPYEWVDDGKGDLKKRFITTTEIEARKLKRAEASAANISLFAPQPGVDAEGNPVFFQPSKRGGTPTIVPGVTPKAPEGYSKQKAGIDSVVGAMESYKDTLGKIGGRIDRLTPSKRLELGTQYNNMMLQAKEAYNLGVLNGPDYMILQQVIKNPLSFESQLYSAKDLQKQVDTFNEVMGRVRQNIEAGYGQKSKSEPNAPAAPVRRYNPATGKIE